MTTIVSSHTTPQYLALPFENSNCPPIKITNDNFTFSAPKLEDSVIKLNEIVIQNNFKKVTLTHKTEMSMNAQGFKIQEGQNGSVLDFIGRNGYRTGIDNEENEDYIRNSSNFF